MNAAFAFAKKRRRCIRGVIVQSSRSPPAVVVRSFGGLSLRLERNESP